MSDAQLVREDHRLRIRAACDRIAELKGAAHLSAIADQLVREMVEGLELELRSAEAGKASTPWSRALSNLEAASGAWTCGACGFRGFWSGGAHCDATDPTSWPPIDESHGC
jgi:hypothetical protein